MRKVQFANNEIYHVYNRGIEHRNIFIKDNDRGYFTECLSRFNHNNGVPLVGILAYSLMPNHFHLLIRQKSEEGVSKYMQKMGISYTIYFNFVEKRSGRLFEGPYKIKPVQNDEYLGQLIGYIHANPLEMLGYNKTYKSKGDALRLLDTYQWSSHGFYSRINDDRSIDMESVIEIFPDFGSYRAFMLGYLSGRKSEDETGSQTQFETRSRRSRTKK